MASGDSLLTFEAARGIPPNSTAAATRDRRGDDGHFVYSFNASTDSSLDFTDVMPRQYAGTTGVTLVIIYMMASATTGGVALDGQFELHDEAGHDMDNSGFAAVNTVTDTVPGTAGQLGYVELTFTDGADMDSVAAGDHFRFRITRDPDHASDTASGALQCVSIEMRET